jgi:hypothetical protein
LNCKKPVDPDSVKFFAQAFVCPVCYECAEHFVLKLEKELRHLLVIAKEAVRLALIEGRFHFNSPGEGVSKKELLEEIVRLEEIRRKKVCTTQETSSGESTPPHVRTLAAMGQSKSNKPSPAD